INIKANRSKKSHSKSEDECFTVDSIYYKSTGYSDNFHKANDLGLRDLISSLNIFCLSNAMKVDEFLNFNDDKNIEIINDEIDDNVESIIISSSLVLNSLES
ncbi:24428_t:CDS:2, partial [Cetraspora pellucida]